MSTVSETPTIGLTHGGSEDTGLGQRGPQSKRESFREAALRSFARETQRSTS